MSYTVINIIKWYEQFDNNIIRISFNKEFLYVDVNKSALPHLLGLQYCEFKEQGKILRGKHLINYILKNKLDDLLIFDKIKKNNPKMIEAVEKRIFTFVEFMKNLENGVIVDMTKTTSSIKSKILIIQNKDGKYLHLGIKEDEKGFEFDSLFISDKHIFETYFLRDKNDYFLNSINEFKINSLEIYDFENDKFLPFSFDEEKNQKLLMEFHQKLEEEKTIENEEDLEIGI